MNEINPASLSNSELVTAVKLLVRKDQEGEGRLIRFLREVDTRGLHTEKGFPCLERYCETILGFTESQARLRTRAMRLSYSVPFVEDKIREGAISVSVASLAERHFRTVAKDGIPLTDRQKAELVGRLDQVSLRDADRFLVEALGLKPPARERKTVFSGGTTRLEFTASMALMRNIERLQELLSHKNFGDRLDLLFEYVCEIALLEMEKVAGAETGVSTRNDGNSVIVLEAVPVTDTPDNPTMIPTKIASAFSKTEKLNRHIPEKNKRLVWERDGGCCQYRDEETERVCGSRRWVQLDHIIEFSLGGSHEPSNLRLLCGAHNRFMYASRFRKRQAAGSFA